MTLQIKKSIEPFENKKYSLPWSSSRFVGTSHPHHRKPVEAQAQSRRHHLPHRHLQRLLVRPRQHSAVKWKYSYFAKLRRDWKYFRGKRVRVIIRKSCQVHNYNCLFSKLQSLQINWAKPISSAVAKRIECDILNGLPLLQIYMKKQRCKFYFFSRQMRFVKVCWDEKKMSWH